MLKSYSDESRRPQSPFLTIAGYVMTENQYEALNEGWGIALGELPYFHMSEGHHKRYPRVYGALLELINPKHMLAGFHAAVHEGYYEQLTSPKLNGQNLRYWFGGAYSFCLSAYMRLVADWLQTDMPAEKRVAYFFDAGDSRAGEADMFLKMVADDKRFETQRLQYRYATHAWLDGKSSAGRVLQAGDILAWHFSRLLSSGEMLAEGKKITRSVKAFYQHYLDPQTIGLTIHSTLDRQKKLTQERGAIKKT
jgi:Protein of unknown function (DUF3800)